MNQIKFLVISSSEYPYEVNFISPTIYFKCLIIDPNNLGRIRELLKSVLYVPGINAKNQRFNLKKQGLFTNYF